MSALILSRSSLSTTAHRAVALSAALGIALSPTSALAEAKTLAVGETFWVGDSTPSSINGGDADETIFGEQVSQAGLPVGLASTLLSVSKHADGTSAPADSDSFLNPVAQSFSPDGTRMLFLSAATNLPVAGSGAGMKEVDLETGEITALPGLGADLNSLVRSPDGKWLAVSKPVAGFAQIQVIEAATGATVTVSRSRVDDALGLADSYDPVFSPDGRYLIFESDSANLVANDTNTVRDLFMVDLTDLPNAHKTMSMVSTRSNGFRVDFESNDGYFTPDGKAIVFTSLADDLDDLSIDITTDSDVFVKTLDLGNMASNWYMKGSVRLVSSNSAGSGKGTGLDTCKSSDPAISPDGTRVAFTSACEKLATDDQAFTQVDVFVKWIASRCSSRWGHRAGLEVGDQRAGQRQ